MKFLSALISDIKLSYLKHDEGNLSKGISCGHNER